MELKVGGVVSNIVDVGYGVSQIYPMLARVIRASQRGIRATFLLQEPEVHLYPRAQAELGSFFVQSAMKDGHAFIIETHGDGIIDRVRVCVSHGEIAPEDVVILYFERDKKTGAVKIHPIHVDKMGNLTDAPPGYRRFFLEETRPHTSPTQKNSAVMCVVVDTNIREAFLSESNKSAALLRAWLEERAGENSCILKRGKWLEEHEGFQRRMAGAS